MTTAGGNADGKLRWRLSLTFCSFEQMEGEEVLRTVECLRGRLLAERAASRNAKQEADLMATKLIELEARLQEETKSRNRAEKRLKFLVKKLESMEIFYVSDESEQSSFVDKCEISSASSAASTSTKTEDKEAYANPDYKIQNIQESTENSAKSWSTVASQDLDQNVSKVSSSASESRQTPVADEEEIHSHPEPTSRKFETGELREKELSPTKICQNSSVEEPHSAKSRDCVSSQNDNKMNMENDSLKLSNKEEELFLNGEIDEEQDHFVDDSMALVPVDLPNKPSQKIDPAALDSTVKEVLNSLRRAKERLQTSMERRRMIKVG
ncbi:uncharacterized protein [Coffea arabica]|uniref:Uncharacterized protein isoform X2 n=1 Tax=Coffea arabica TaxID=13443 RepID=A0A6P6SWM9_COFAR